MNDNYQAVFDAIRSRFHGCDTGDILQRVIAESFGSAYQQIQSAFSEIASEHTRPFVMLRPKVFIDGNQWCCLYGENLQDGICGFGESAHRAALDFDSNFYKKLEP